MHRVRRVCLLCGGALHRRKEIAYFVKTSAMLSLRLSMALDAFQIHHSGVRSPSVTTRPEA